MQPGGPRLEFSLGEQVGLILPEMFLVQLIWRFAKIGRELFDGLKVILYSGFSEVTTLEFLQHHFSEMGHRDLLVTHKIPLRSAG